VLWLEDKLNANKIMAKGRQGMYLEAWKFGVYLMIPIVATAYYAAPQRQKAAADYWQFVKYPANPNTDLRKNIQKELEQDKQREVYRQQLSQLMKEPQNDAEEQAEPSKSKRPWWRIWGRSKTDEQKA
jgi:hypothetical protein